MVHVDLDEDVPVRLAPLLVSEGHATHTTRDEQRKSAGDDEQLIYAAQQRWILVTHNKRDFRLLHDAWRRWRCQSPHAGILLLEHAPPETLATALADFCRAHDQLGGELWEWSPTHGWESQPRALRWVVPPPVADNPMLTSP